MPDPILNKQGEPISYTRDKYESVGFNAELADEVLEVIHAFPENHNQDAWCQPGNDRHNYWGDESDPSCEVAVRDQFIENPIETAWSCGTGMCFAGWTVALGVGLDWDEVTRNGEPAVVGGVERDPRYGTFWGSEIAEAAIQLLGITRREANKLFAADNTESDLEKIVAKLKRKYGVES